MSDDHDTVPPSGDDLRELLQVVANDLARVDRAAEERDEAAWDRATDLARRVSRLEQLVAEVVQMFSSPLGPLPPRADEILAELRGAVQRSDEDRSSGGHQP